MPWREYDEKSTLRGLLKARQPKEKKMAHAQGNRRDSERIGADSTALCQPFSCGEMVRRGIS